MPAPAVRLSALLLRPDIECFARTWKPGSHAGCARSRFYSEAVE